jgi:hypothetical protein
MHEGACNRADHPDLDATRATPLGSPGHPEQRRCARAHEGQVALRDGLSRQLVLGWAEFTGFLPAAWRGKGASCVLRTTPLSADEGIHQAAADSRRRPEHAYAGGAGPVRASQAQKSPIGPPPRSLAGPGRTCRRLLECSPLAVVRTAPDSPGTLVVRGAGAGCAGGRIRCLPGRPELASSRCRPGRRRRAWRRERAAAPARRPGRGRWR